MRTRWVIARAEENTESGALAGTGAGAVLKELENQAATRRRTKEMTPRRPLQGGAARVASSGAAVSGPGWVSLAGPVRVAEPTRG